MATFVFKCPTTELFVQHWFDDDESAPEDEYEGMACPACGKVHFINQSTRKLLGQDDK